MSNKHIEIASDQARQFFLQKQLLNKPTIPKGKVGVLSVIEKLGYVQVDTINVIERSHHIVLFTRCPDYKQKYLHVLQAKDMKIFEYWAHAASFIPMTDYRFYIRTIEKRPKEDSWHGKWIKENRNLINKVRKRVEKEGPLTASDFGDITHRKRGTWWDWKPAKMALETLFWQGILMIKERRNFQRVYDITERVLPRNTNTIKPTIDGEKRFFITKALGALGIATTKDINSYIGVGGKLNEWVDKMLKTKEIVEIEIKGIKKPYYILSKDIPELLIKKKNINTTVHFLSPFDNSIILRDRTSTLFEFNYSLECYVPKNKRKYGYFCLPILWQNQFVGRIDSKADRQNKILLINNIHLEDKKIISNDFMHAFTQSLVNFSHFHGCKKIEFNKKIPTKLTKTILRHY